MTAEKYDITNVPSVVWVDEQDRIVKPPTIAPGDDSFREYTKIDSARHHDALRAWVATGELPEQRRAGSRRPGPTTASGRSGSAGSRPTSYAAATPTAGGSHLAAAQELAPWDWTVRRGGIALTGATPSSARSSSPSGRSGIAQAGLGTAPPDGRTTHRVGS